jgi:hypothetical protein
MSFDAKTYHRERRERLAAAGLCLACEAPLDGDHIRCNACHEGHLEESRQSYRLNYQSRGSGFTCGACGNTGHNRRTCVARAA